MLVENCTQGVENMLGASDRKVYTVTIVMTKERSESATASVMDTGEC